MTESHPDRSVTSTRSGRIRYVAGLAVVAMGAATIVAAGGGSAGAVVASTAAIKAQSVGRFLDGVVGGMPVESLVDVKDARATAPGTTSDQNPFDVKLFNQADIPVTNAINIPTSPAVKAGLVNQVATAKEDGSSLGASGAVSNNGGISAGGDSAGAPDVASVNLSQDALPTGIPGADGLPGLGSTSLPALGGITAGIGAVSAQAQTAVGGQVTPEPKYNIAGLNLTIASPALGNVLQMISDALDTSALPAPPDLGGILNLPTGFTIPAACSPSTQVLSPISLEDGAVKISPTSGSITISLDKLLDEFDININELPANTDLLAYVLSYITQPKLLAMSLENVISGLIDPLKKNFTDCLTAISGQAGPLAALLQPLIDAINTGQSTITSAINMIIDPLADATAGANPLAPLADALKNVVDIGVNVESGPGIQPTQGNEALQYTTGLDKTANQTTDVQDGQTLVRALEIDLLNVDTSGFGGLPGTGSSSSAGPSDVPTSDVPTSDVPTSDVPTSDVPTSGGLPTLPIPFANVANRFDAAAATAAPNAMGVSLAFASASVGPTTDATTGTPGSSTPASRVPSTAIPIGVPAGQAGGDGSPVLPFVLLMLGLTIAGGGLVAYRKRGRFAA